MNRTDINNEDVARMYHDEKMPLNEIAGFLGCCSRTIYNRLQQNNTPARTISEARYLKNAKIEIDWGSIAEIFDGNMLGDGGVYPSTLKTAYYIQAATTRYLSFLEDIKMNFDEAGLISKIYGPTKHKRGVKYYYTYLLNTISHPDLKAQRDRWYPDGKKIVPEDVLITPKSAAYWYMGDGSFDPDGSARIATHCFTHGDIAFLFELLIDELKIEDCWPQADGRDRYRIYIPVRAFPRFVEIIEPYVLPVFRYKLGEGK